MVDCGEGRQRQLLRSGAGFRRLDRLLLTHDHFDHVLGIPGLFLTLRLRQSTDVMTIHGSPGTLDVVVRMLAGLWGEGRAPIPLQPNSASHGLSGWFSHTQPVPRQVGHLGFMSSTAP